MRNRCRRCYCMNNNVFNNNCENKCDKDNKSIFENSCMNAVSPEMEYNNNCSCGFDDDYNDNVFPENPMLAQSYVPIQTMDEVFKPCYGLKKGTIFPKLVSPYEPGDSMKQIKYLEKTNSIGEGCNKCQ